MRPIAKPSPARPATPGDVLAELRALARRGSHVRASDLAGAQAAIPVRATGADGDDGGDEIGSVSRAALEAAIADGMVAPSVAADGLPALFRLTRAGRERLRRLRAEAMVDAASAKPAAGLPAPTAPAAMPARNVAESPVAWLSTRRDAGGRPLLSEAQRDAGERLRADLTLAGLTPRTTMSWSGLAGDGTSHRGPKPGESLADTLVAARQRVTRALAAVGPEHAGILIDVCGHLKGLDAIAAAEGWPRRSARIVLQRALTALARHYGLIAAVPVEQAIAERLRHWGAPDYRPSLDRRREGADQAD